MSPKLALFGRKKTTRAFKDYYAQWLHTLKATLLPLLRRSLSSDHHLLSTHVESLHHHFQSYYQTLDAAAQNDTVAHLLHPTWRNPMEAPFLWLGDLHPYTFTNLLRSFLDKDSDESSSDEDVSCVSRDFLDKPWHVTTAFRSPSKSLMAKIDQIECGLRLMAPALAVRYRNAQAGFVEKVGAEWEKCESGSAAAREVVAEAATAEMEELVGVFVDANRLRRSVLAEIMGCTSIYQAALFYQGLAQFLVGFWDRELLREFERCKMPIY
ncbi:hypothetical protein RJ640_027283 [Escallonia rubra]|uniref:DOG1 domain-containing protein n=1 Tax=Escallonia rubra TaxID=112253 RepID=A0AA88RGH0_9ASTE|nr:hypothetical protein RJ640_027283 [Escallonia rubra]